MTASTEGNGQRQVKILTRRRVHDRFLGVEILTLKHSVFGGGWSRDLDRELVLRPAGAAVLPYDPASDKIVLVEQFRTGAIARPDGAWLLEVVAGAIGPGETPEEVARREAVEEAGLAIRSLSPIARFYPTPGYSDEVIDLFYGECDAPSSGGIHGLGHEDEDIRVHVVSGDEAVDPALLARCENATTVIALQWFAANRERFRR